MRAQGHRNQALARMIDVNRRLHQLPPIGTQRWSGLGIVGVIAISQHLITALASEHSHGGPLRNGNSNLRLAEVFENVRATSIRTLTACPFFIAGSNCQVLRTFMADSVWSGESVLLTGFASATRPLNLIISSARNSPGYADHSSGMGVRRGSTEHWQSGSARRLGVEGMGSWAGRR